MNAVVIEAAVSELAAAAYAAAEFPFLAAVDTKTTMTCWPNWIRAAATTSAYCAM
jgi:hypothetical protein